MVEIYIKNLQKKIPVSPKRIKGVILKVLSSERKTAPSGVITLCFVDDRLIRRLNRKYHFRDRATDVLAFDLSDTRQVLSDIFISTDTAISNAKIFKTTPLYENYLYLVHGLLHILGYDDNNAKNRTVMRAKEEYYMNKCQMTKSKCQNE
jgi:probable rRNA maturation factor